jgi:hypothetical protein
VIFSWLDTDSLGLYNIKSFVNNIIDNQLGGALTDLTLHVEHETATKHVDFVIVTTAGVSASTNDFVVGVIWYVAPGGASVFVSISVELKLGNFFVAFMV